MKLTKEAIFSIIVVILFIGSIFGIAISSSNFNDSNTKEDENQSQEDLEEKMYLAQVDANVLDKFPQLTIISDTNKFEKTEIEIDLKEIDGIKDATVNFNKDENNNIISISRINYNMDKEENVIKQIDNYNGFENNELFQSALLNIPSKEIKLVNDQNQTKNYTFSNTNIEGIISYNTQKTDNITVQLQTMFLGDKLSRILGIEMQNKSAQPKMIAETLNLKADEFSGNYQITGLFDLNKTIDENIIKEKINDINSEIYITNQTYLEVVSKNDLNKSLTNIQDENNSIVSNFEIDSNITKIYLKQDYDVNNYFDFLNQIDVNTIKKPKKEIIIHTISKDINNLDLEELKIQKEAIFNIDQIEINNKIYNLDKNTQTSFVNLDNDLNTEIELNLQGYAIRNDLMIFGLEEK